MYSGTTFRTKSGRIMAVHQRIDRIARRSLAKHLGKTKSFPTISNILHFEGKNGPDGIKSKSPGKDEPWHYIDPKQLDNAPLLTYIADHIHNLHHALNAKNDERAAFEAAWLAHAITDGMTAAHHYPLEARLNEIRGENGLTSRDSIRKKIVLPGKTKREVIKNNWEFWGAKGVMTTHFAFEWGVMASIAGQSFQDVVVSDEHRQALKMGGFISQYKDAVQRIDSMHMYEDFIKNGWTRRLGNETKDTLIPAIVEMVTLAWLAAYEGWM